MPCRKCGITDSGTDKERLLQKERERLKTLPLLAERYRPVSVQVQGQGKKVERSEWPPRTLKGVLLTAETRRKIWSIGRGGR
jgi:hypothetical protein